MAEVPPPTNPYVAVPLGDTRILPSSRRTRDPWEQLFSSDTTRSQTTADPAWADLFSSTSASSDTTKPQTTADSAWADLFSSTPASATVEAVATPDEGKSTSHVSPFECAVCFHEFCETGERVPHSLFCGHTFCRSCIGRLMAGPARARCPLCQHQIKGPLSAIPRCFALIPLLKLRHMAKESSHHSTKGKGKKAAEAAAAGLGFSESASAEGVSAEESNGKCAKCQDKEEEFSCLSCKCCYCSSCWDQVHCFGPLLRHAKQPLTEWLDRYCPTHPCYLQELVCVDLACSQRGCLLCPLCEKANHRGHHVELLPTAAQMFRQDFQACVNQFNAHLDEVGALLLRVQNASHRLSISSPKSLSSLALSSSSSSPVSSSPLRSSLSSSPHRTSHLPSSSPSPSSLLTPSSISPSSISPSSISPSSISPSSISPSSVPPSSVPPSSVPPSAVPPSPPRIQTSDLSTVPRLPSSLPSAIPPLFCSVVSLPFPSSTSSPAPLSSSPLPPLLRSSRRSELIVPDKSNDEEEPEPEKEVENDENKRKQEEENEQQEEEEQAEEEQEEQEEQEEEGIKESLVRRIIQVFEEARVALNAQEATVLRELDTTIIRKRELYQQQSSELEKFLTLSFPIAERAAKILEIEDDYVFIGACEKSRAEIMALCRKTKLHMQLRLSPDIDASFSRTFFEQIPALVSLPPFHIPALPRIAISELPQPLAPTLFSPISAASSNSSSSTSSSSSSTPAPTPTESTPAPPTPTPTPTPISISVPTPPTTFPYATPIPTSTVSHPPIPTSTVPYPTPTLTPTPISISVPTPPTTFPYATPITTSTVPYPPIPTSTVPYPPTSTVPYNQPPVHLPGPPVPIATCFSPFPPPEYPLPQPSATTPTACFVSTTTTTTPYPRVLPRSSITPLPYARPPRSAS